DRPDLRAERKERRGHLLLIALPLVLLAVLFIYPVLGLLRYSLLDGDAFSLAQYQKIIDEPLYLQVLLLTFRTAFYTTVLCVLLGYPLAYGIVNLPQRLQALALTLVVVPFFISLIVRTYAWMVLLGRNGLVNSVLTSLPFFEPVQLMY